MTSDATKGTSLHFDPYNQLDSVAVPGYGPSCLRFAYNSSGERVSKTHVYWRREVCGGGIYKVLESTGTSGVSGPEPPPDTLASMCWKQKTASTYYVYGNGQVLAEYANPAVAGSPKAKYIYAGDRRIAMIDQSGNLFFYLNDHLGSARVVMNAQTGRAADYHWYSAYGSAWGEQTSTNQAYKYTGKPFDDEGGFDLYYYGARYYDPDRGFISVDPLASEYPGWSPYVYVKNNPMKMVDPSGEDAVDFVVGVGQGVWGEVKSAGVGLWDLGEGLATDPGQTLSDVGGGLSFAISNPGEVWNQVSDHVSDTWQSGDQGKGQIVGEIGVAIATIVVGTKGADKLGKLSKVSKLKGLMTPKKLFGGMNKTKATGFLKSKLGQPRYTNKFQSSFFNAKTKRSFNVHQQPGHQGGKAHVDIRSRKPKVEDRKVILEE